MPIDMSKIVVFHIPYQTKEKKVKKEWGCEYILPNPSTNRKDFTTKIMEVKPGFFCSLHFHNEKEENFVLVQGVIDIELYDADSTKYTIRLDEPMSSVIIPHCVPHTFSVPADQEFNTIFIESSSKDDPKDSYRLTRSGKNAK